MEHVDSVTKWCFWSCHEAREVQAHTFRGGVNAVPTALTHSVPLSLPLTFTSTLLASPQENSSFEGPTLTGPKATLHGVTLCTAPSCTSLCNALLTAAATGGNSFLLTYSAARLLPVMIAAALAIPNAIHPAIFHACEPPLLRLRMPVLLPLLPLLLALDDDSRRGFFTASDDGMLGRAPLLLTVRSGNSFPLI